MSNDAYHKEKNTNIIMRGVFNSISCTVKMGKPMELESFSLVLLFTKSYVQQFRNSPQGIRRTP